ncbi:C40 family peptidase [filamentous cyanobacterium LEGE 11480]|uniref:C40 family peptidase n=1 Tax=Romeriopsis navalis LEGE 11480 TaxID=2777977 RepID=A0A928VVA4_9CYAN|nr:C40 family peptidase [Romeriopsis navalis]MBE9033235.1 C40 family peptidase [Romeriopsis navalis LEGE 11480]
MQINRRSLLIPWAGLIALFIVLIRQSVSYGIMRLGIVVTGLLVIAGLIYFVWQQSIVRWGIITIVTSFSVFLLLPGELEAGKHLQPNYGAMLKTYEGSPYVWGGENHLGIDCSGLVREGLIQTNLHHGFQTLNPALIRQGLEMWWFDAGADALLREYRGYTQRQFTAVSINELDHRKIQPGDLAATTDGEHILAYLGNQSWIEADPNLQKVVIESVPTPNPWFHTAVQILRWRQFG